MAYNFTKKTCDKCGAKEEPENRALDYHAMCLAGFRLGYDGSVLCAKCHKEKELESLFALMDAKFT